MNNPYKCWCEWLKNLTHTRKMQDYDRYHRRVHEDIKHHAYAECEEKQEAKCRECKAPKPKGPKAICPDCGAGMSLECGIGGVALGWRCCGHCDTLHPMSLFEEVKSE